MESDAAVQCVARGRAYDLLGTALLDGLRADRVAHFQAVPALAAHIDTATDPDHWAAAHHTALALEVPPFESTFLSPSGQMDDGAAVRQAHAKGGFSGARDDVPPDHAGTALHYLSWLSGAEADAVRDGQAAALQEVQSLSRTFIDAHPGRWLSSLAVGLQTSPAVHPFFAEVALLSAELVADHRSQLSPEPDSWALPEVTDPLLDPETRLADLARHLTTPSCAGGVLSRSALAAVGRATCVPKGFGSRALMLTNLMKSAAELDSLSEVLGGLGHVVAGWVDAHQRLGPSVWTARAQATVSLLQRMDAALGLRE